MPSCAGPAAASAEGGADAALAEAVRRSFGDGLSYQFGAVTALS